MKHQTPEFQKILRRIKEKRRVKESKSSGIDVVENLVGGAKQSDVEKKETVTPNETLPVRKNLKKNASGIVHGVKRRDPPSKPLSPKIRGGGSRGKGEKG